MKLFSVSALIVIVLLASCKLNSESQKESINANKDLATVFDKFHEE